jgi:peptidoglycan/LPS O-acetylase OafA/YrhL
MFRTLRAEINDPKRIYGLDVLRAIAVAIVVYEHGNFILDKASPTLASIPIIDGVDLFFVLSGFLIGGILLRSLAREQRIGFSFVKAFLVRRWFRTLPNYFLFLGLNILLISMGLASGFINKYLITFFVFMQNFFKPYDFLYWESWSLSVEEWFYLLFPIGILIFSFLIKNRKYLFLTLTFLLIACSTAVRFYKARDAGYTYESWDFWIRKLVPCRFDSIGFGLLAAWIHFYYQDIWVKSRWFCFFVGIVLFGVVLNYNFNNSPYFACTSYFTVSAMAAMFVLPLAEQERVGTGWFAKSITGLSLISYAVYLTNLGIIGALIINNTHYWEHAWLYYFLYWGGTLLFSALVYNYFEKPFTNLRERFT